MPRRDPEHTRRRRDEPVARLFVALYPPPETVAALAVAAARLALPEHRLTPPDQVHVTVHFLGPIPQRENDAAAESLRRAASGLAPFDLEPRRLIGLPPRRPRLVAAEMNLPADLHELHRRLVTRLARPGKKPDRFLPHITLLRFAGAAKAGAAVDALPAELPDDDPARRPFTVRSVHLVRSILRPEGAEHRTIEDVPLG